MLNKMEFGAGRVGPESCRIADLKREFVASPLETLAPFYISRAKGALITDVNGNQYIDFTKVVNDNQIAAADYPLDNRALKKSVIPETDSKALQIGKAAREARG